MHMMRFLLEETKPEGTEVPVGTKCSAPPNGGVRVQMSN